MIKLASEPELPEMPGVALDRRFDLGALGTLLALSLQRLVRSRGVWFVVLPFCLPTAFALLARYKDPDFNPASAEQNLILYFIPQVLVPMAALVLCSGLIQDEVEEQTLTYLWIRPLPRWSIYAAKWLAVALVVASVSFLFTLAALAAIHWGEAGLWSDVILGRGWKLAAIWAVASVAYTSLFGILSLFLRKIQPLGIAYIVLFEGVFANIDFVVRKVTVMYYVRILIERWIGVHVESWSIDLESAPSGAVALLTLVGAIGILTVFSGWVVGVREYRMKTPEDS